MKYYALRAIPTASISILLYYCWTCVKSYDAIVFCLHVICYTTTCYRHSLDRDGSILLLALLLINILTTFYLKSLIVTIFLFVISSTVLKPCFTFIQNMMYKIFADFIIAFVKYLFTYPCDVSSRLTDFSYLATFIFEHTLLSFPRNGKEDVFLAALSLFQVIVLIFELYAYKYLCFIIFLTVLWIYLKSFKIQRPLFDLTYLSFL